MDLWQLVCYLEGYHCLIVNRQISNIIQAVQIGQYTGQYFSGKRAPDPKIIISKLENSLNNNNSSSNEEAIEKINKLKKQLQYFKK